MVKNDFIVRFWGVRGSFPTLENNKMRFGGNTSCVEMNIDNKILIFDGGTGIQRLGKNLQNKNIRADIFITHLHWDHIQGLPFFNPFFNSENIFNIYGQDKNNITFEEAIKGIMKYPYSPITWDDFSAKTNFISIKENSKINIGNNIIVKTIETDHPDGCIAYKVEYKNISCCYITDLEHTEKVDNKIKNFVKDSNLLIYDSNYTEEEYLGLNNNSKIGWGHSTWEKGVKLANEANIKELILFHHNPERSDDELYLIENMAKKKFKNTQAAHESLKITPRDG